LVYIRYRRKSGPHLYHQQNVQRELFEPYDDGWLEYEETFIDVQA
jgi:hypothetical protein